MPDVAVDVFLLAFVEDLVPSTGVEATLEGPLSIHLAGGQALDRRRLTARRVFGPRADKDWKL